MDFNNFALSENGRFLKKTHFVLFSPYFILYFFYSNRSREINRKNITIKIISPAVFIEKYKVQKQDTAQYIAIEDS